MLDFVAASPVALPNVDLLALTPQREIAQRAAERKGLAASTPVLSASPEEVPDYICAADFGILLIAVLNAGAGGTDALSREAAWVFVREKGPFAARRIKELLARLDRREFARDLAARFVAPAKAVDSYDRLSRELVSPGVAT